MEEQTILKDKTRVARPWRRARFERFAQRQSATHDWIAFKEIADFYARESGSIESDARKHILTLDELRDGILGGEFDVRNKAQILYANGETKLGRLSAERVRDLLLINAEDCYQLYLMYCWAPRRFVLRWAEKRRLSPSPRWIERAEAQVDPSATRTAPKATAPADLSTVEFHPADPTLRAAMLEEGRSRAAKAREHRLPGQIVERIVVEKLDAEMPSDRPRTRANLIRSAKRKMEEINRQIDEERIRYNLNRATQYNDPDSIYRAYRRAKNRMAE